MSEELLVQHCSPTLAGMKAGSMFPCQYDSPRELFEDMIELNERLNCKELKLIPLRYRNKKALVLVYRPNLIKKVLENKVAVEILKKYGYEKMDVDSCIDRLLERFSESEEFPHEVGLFLGYPPEDVCGFIANKACGGKCVGCWKVYGDEKEALKTFEKYKKCKAVYCDQWAKGRSIERLSVAV